MKIVCIPRAFVIGLFLIGAVWGRAAAQDSLSDFAYRAWEVTGRSWLERHSGLRWSPDEGWHDRGSEEPIAPMDLYDLEFILRPAVVLGEESRRPELLDELAAFHIALLPRLTTLGRLRDSGLFVRTYLLDGQGPDATRTVGSIEPGRFLSRALECTLCTSQAFYPAARLLRVIAQLPGSSRTPTMHRFVDLYSNLLVDEHLVRVLRDADMSLWYWEAPVPESLIDIWRYILIADRAPSLSYQHAMHDRDVWLLATAAEVLGAHAADEDYVRLAHDDESVLREAIDVGLELFRSKVHERVFEDRAGVERIGARYFPGDLDDHAEMAFARYESTVFPTEEDRAPATQGTWDFSHFYRIPVFFRAFMDNGAAIGVDFPTSDELERLGNEFAFTSFNGDLRMPNFSNYFDGRDGWFRVELGSGYGYPPSRYCDQESKGRPCLINAGIFGWGQLAVAHPEVARIYEAIIELARASDSNTVAFRRRHYSWEGEDFSFESAAGEARFPMMLFSVVAESMHALQ